MKHLYLFRSSPNKYFMDSVVYNMSKGFWVSFKLYLR